MSVIKTNERELTSKISEWINEIIKNLEYLENANRINEIENHILTLVTKISYGIC